MPPAPPTPAPPAWGAALRWSTVLPDLLRLHSTRRGRHASAFFYWSQSGELVKTLTSENVSDLRRYLLRWLHGRAENSAARTASARRPRRTGAPAHAKELLHPDDVRRCPPPPELPRGGAPPRSARPGRPGDGGRDTARHRWARQRAVQERRGRRHRGPHVGAGRRQRRGRRDGHLQDQRRRPAPGRGREGAERRGLAHRRQQLRHLEVPDRPDEHDGRLLQGHLRQGGDLPVLLPGPLRLRDDTGQAWRLLAGIRAAGRRRPTRGGGCLRLPALLPGVPPEPLSPTFRGRRG